MAKKPYIIVTASPKGGVGKTVVSINVATALRTSGYDVLLIDTDVANPSVGLLLGSGIEGPGYQEVLLGKANLKDVLILYPLSGFYYLNAGGDGNEIAATTEQVSKFYAEISKTDFDFIIVDTPPGAKIEPAMKLFNEALIVTTPEETAVKGAQRLSSFYLKYHLLHKLVINRVKEAKFDMTEEMIEKLYGDVAYALVPEEKTVAESESRHMPAYLINRTSLFSISIDDLCRSYLLMIGAQVDQPSQKGGWGIKRFFTKK
ncbi:MAG: P-loop NTPase [Candidatus Micrarchaeota archaeon]|nr:P-loop NTPase [Candidatus Micrarchaeota archaeon]